MDLSTFTNSQKVTEVDLVFPFNTTKELVEEAERNPKKVWKSFQIFFSGGKIELKRRCKRHLKEMPICMLRV